MYINNYLLFIVEDDIARDTNDNGCEEIGKEVTRAWGVLTTGQCMNSVILCLHIAIAIRSVVSI